MRAHDRLDQLIYLDETQQLTDDEVRKLFPDYDSNDTKFDHLIDATFAEQWLDRRSTGMTIEKTAHDMGFSATLFKKLLQGEGLSMDIFVMLAKYETSAVAKFRYKHLKNLDRQSDSGLVAASIAALEKIEPEEFTPRTEQTLRIDWEERAAKGRDDLLRLREERQKRRS